MGRLFRVRVAVICFSVFFTQHFTMQRAAAQAPDANEKKLTPRTPEMAEKGLQSQRHISLDVVATDSTGKPVSGFQQQDFTILDNNQPQKITSFEAVQGATADPPLEVV